MTFEIYNSEGIRKVDNIPFSELERTLRSYIANHPKDIRVIVHGLPLLPDPKKGYCNVDDLDHLEFNKGGDYDPPLRSVISDHKNIQS